MRRSSNTPPCRAGAGARPRPIDRSARLNRWRPSDRSARVVLSGRAGDDRIFGGVGDDRLRGGPGRDLLVGGPGGTDPMVARLATSAIPRSAAPADGSDPPSPGRDRPSRAHRPAMASAGQARSRRSQGPGKPRATGPRQCDMSVGEVTWAVALRRVAATIGGFLQRYQEGRRT
ncbi:MAG: calcium-binding protein [Acidimicrobiales bacterium]